MPAGYTIRVTSPPRGGASIQEYFDVAIDDQDEALEVVRIAARVADGTPIEVVGELSLADLVKIGVLRGEVLSVRKAIAGSERQQRARR
jgi:hypothetical protein